MTHIELEDDEAVLLHALALYATALKKPPVNDVGDIPALVEIAELHIALAPAEVMQRLANKMRTLTPVVTHQRPGILAEWRRLLV